MIGSITSCQSEVPHSEPICHALRQCRCVLTTLIPPVVFCIHLDGPPIVAIDALETANGFVQGSKCSQHSQT